MSSAVERLICFVGDIGSGKSTCASILVEHCGFAHVPFAGPFKRMLRSVGLTEAQVDGDQKQMPCDLLCGKSPRLAMQTLGTEWGRYLIGDDLWVRLWLEDVERQLCRRIVVDDCRFANEVEAVRSLGGKIIRISRPGFERPSSSHVSEAYRFPHDAEIVNRGSVDDLRMAVVEAIRW